MAKSDEPSLKREVKRHNKDRGGQSSLESGVFSTDPEQNRSDRLPSDAEEDRRQARQRED